MLIINIVAYFVESFILIYTLNSIFEESFYRKEFFYVVVTTVIIMIMKYYSFHMIFQIIILTLFYTIYLCYHYSHYQHVYFLYSLCLLCLLALSRVIGNQCATLLSNVPKINFVTNEYDYASSFVAILFFMAFAFLFHYCVVGKDKSKKIRSRLLFGVNVFVLIAMFINLLESVIFSNFNIYTIYSLFIELIILTVCIISLYIKLMIQQKQSLVMSQQITKMQYQNQMYSIVSKVKDQMANEKHMMLYNFMNMKLLLASNNKKALKEYIDKEIDKMMKYKYISSTGNALFDYTMTNKLNHLINKNIDTKTVFMLSRNNTLLENESIVNYIMDCIDQMMSLNSQKIEIFMNEYNQKYILLKMIVYTKQKKDLEENHFIHPNTKKINIKRENMYYEISILLG